MDDHDHGLRAYRRGCRCSECRAANASAMREYTARRKERVPPPTEQKCTKCHQIKPLEAFSMNSRTKFGYLRICKDCKNAYRRDYMARSPDQRRKARERRWEWRADPDNREYENVQQYERQAKNKERQARIYRKHLLKKNYGITLEEYDALVETQGGCAICGDQPSGKHKYFHVDHDHDTGETRALLCSFCNVGLGSFKDDPVRLANAVKYLAQHGKVRPKETV